jgi:hypothetical protein
MVHVQKALYILTIFCSITQILKLLHQCQLHAHVPQSRRGIQKISDCTFNNSDFNTKLYWKKGGYCIFYVFITPLLGVIFNYFSRVIVKGSDCKGGDCEGE